MVYAEPRTLAAEPARCRDGWRSGWVTGSKVDAIDISEDQLTVARAYATRRRRRHDHLQRRKRL